MGHVTTTVSRGCRGSGARLGLIVNSRWRVRFDRVLGRPWLAWAVLCVSAGLFLGLWYVLSIDYAERANARFELRARVLHAELSERMLDYVRVLDGGAGLFEASD